MRFFPFSQFLIDNTKAGTFYGNPNCRMAAYFAQTGLCYVTGRVLVEKERELHHRLPRYYGGPDTPENLILLDIRVHKLVHAYSPRRIDALLAELKLTERQLRMVEQLRMEAFMPLLKQKQPSASSAA